MQINRLGEKLYWCLIINIVVIGGVYLTIKGIFIVAQAIYSLAAIIF